MGIKWLPIITDLFRPEHSLEFFCGKREPINRYIPAGLPQSVSIKALFWTAVSIAIGLALAQLR